MAQELYLLRNGVNILTEPNTPITDFTVSISHMGDNKLSAKFHYPKRISFDMTEYVVYQREGEYNTEFKGEWINEYVYSMGDSVLYNGILYISTESDNYDDEPSGLISWDVYDEQVHGVSPIEIYYLYQPPTWVKDEKSLMIEYNCDFTAKSEVLKYIPMIDSWEAAGDGLAPKKPFLYQTEYSFFGGIQEYFDNIKSSMVAEFGGELVGDTIQPIGWRMYLDLSQGYDQEGENIEISVSNTNVMAALQDIYTKFKVPFFMANNVITVGGQKKYVEHRFRYGKGKGLYKLTKTKLNEDIITKVKGVGSERNIPYNYLQNEKKNAGLAETPMSRLMPFVFRETLACAAAFPSEVSAVKDYYLSENYNEKFPRISFQTIDDIYPTIKLSTFDVAGSRPDKRIDKIVGVYFEASSVNMENATKIKDDKEEVENPRFWIKIPPLGFDLKNCLNEKDKLVLSPTTGYCGGCKFNVLSIGSKPNRWEGYRVTTLYDYDKFITPAINQGVFSQSVNQVTYDSNTVELPPSTTIAYNFIGEISVNTNDSDTAGGVVAIHVRKNGNYHASLYSTSLEPTEAGEFTAAIAASGTYTVGSSESIGQYSIHITVTTYTDNNLSSATVVVNRTECLITFPVSPEQFSDTTNESQWLLVQKDIDSYNTLMPYPLEPMWTNYASPDEWLQYHTGGDYPVGLVPQIDDEYVFLGITLPEKYIIDAEKRLETALLLLLNNNKDFKYTYDCGFDEKMLIENPSINSDIQIGSVVRIYENTDPSEYVDEENYEEVVINSLNLRYSADRVLASQTGN